MQKKRPFVIFILIIATFGAIALLNASMTGYSVYGKMSSIFSGNTLSTMGPTIMMVTIIGVGVVALRRKVRQ